MKPLLFAATIAATTAITLNPIATADPTTTPTPNSVSQQSAIRKAQDYLDLGGISRQDLINQLEFDHFSESEATYAVDSLGADWNTQAALKAKEFLAMDGFSRKDLLDQLEFEGFTPAQAQYGVTAAGL